MKDVEVEVISKEIMKPSSPTPDHLRHYQFSYLDQITPAVYGSLVHFYELNDKTQPNNNITEISNHLKKSLAQVLTLFYPLAGMVDIDIVRPQFISATLFPPKESTGFDSAAGITRNRVTKRFVFDKHMVEVLRTTYKGRPSRVEALSTFIWSRLVAATKNDTTRPNIENSKSNSYMVIMMHAVNLRPRFDPPLPQCSFGNLSRLAITAPDQDCCGGKI